MSVVVANLTCGYSGKPVVENVSFAIKPGGVTCVLGPNGVGKTTIFKTILGFLPSLAGSVQIDGVDSPRLSRAQVAQTIAYVPQSQTMPFSFTVEEFVLMGRAPHLRLLQQPGPEDRAIALEALEEIGALHLAQKSCTEVSGGEMQLACIARALANVSNLRKCLVVAL